MTEHADYKGEAEDYAARCPAEPATGDDITGADGALVISIPEAKYPAGKTATARDAVLTPGNIKDGVDLFGVVGTFEGVAGLLIKSVQSGWITLANGVVSATTAITEVDLSQSVCLFNGFYTLTNEPDDTYCTVKLSDSTHVEAQRISTAEPVTVRFTVIEFEGLTSVQQGTITLNVGVVDVTQGIDEVDLDKAVLFYGGFRTNMGVASGIYMTQWNASVWINDSTRVRAYRQYGPNCYVSTNYTVVEFP